MKESIQKIIDIQKKQLRVEENKGNLSSKKLDNYQ